MADKHHAAMVQRKLSEANGKGEKLTQSTKEYQFLTKLDNQVNSTVIINAIKIESYNYCRNTETDNMMYK